MASREAVRQQQGARRAKAVADMSSSKEGAQGIRGGMSDISNKVDKEHASGEGVAGHRHRR